MSRYEPVANVRVSQLAICLDCGALVPIKWRTHHDLFHVAIVQLATIAADEAT